jgi:hypothetical protein
MLDRRESTGDEGLRGGAAETSGHDGTTSAPVARNISESGGSFQFSDTAKLSMEQMSLRIARKARSFLTRIHWWRNNFVGFAFGSEQPFQLPFSDLEQRLLNSDNKKRQLQRRINQLLREG